MDKADPQEATWMNLSSFPETILAHIGDFLTFGDRRNLFTTCRTLRENSSSLSQLLAVATVASPRDAEVFRRFFQDHAVNIIHFDLGAFASDTFLQGMSGIAGNDPSLAAHVLDDSRLPTRMPNLRSVAMVGAQQVTDRGLIYLALGGPRTHNLRRIDITYCHRTTYAGTFFVRERLRHLEELRRQPRWMDGSFETPFENDGLHTYYCDGTFVFQREQQSCGYVIQVRQWSEADPFFVHDKLQYSNFTVPDGWPLWAQYCYRPGVSLLRLDDQEALVAQSLRGLRPPQQYPQRVHAALLPRAKMSVYFDQNGTLLPNASSTDLRNNDAATNNDFSLRQHYMVSRMRIFPLTQLMPPPELVQRNRVFCDTMMQQLNMQILQSEPIAEDSLHRALGGA